MGLGRYVVDAITLEGRSPSELARSHGVSRTWIYELLRRYRKGGYAALEPRSHRPRSCPHQVRPAVVHAILRLRRQLTAAGHDAGPQTIAQHLGRRRKEVPSPATIWRILKRNGLISPQPHKRPRSSFHRFEAQLPNELWQADATHWSLASGTSVEILNVLDDHSRLLLAAVAFPTVKAADVVQVFAAAAAAYGLPAAFLTDNAAVFAGQYRGGTVLLESELARLGIRVVHSRAYHPQTCGKVERFHQTLKRFLAKQAPPISIAHLQTQLDAFRSYYNQRRPHRALGQRTPLAAFNARLRARPAPIAAATLFRVRLDKVDGSGRVTLRYLSVLRHIYVGRAHCRERIRLLIAGRDVRVISESGELLGEVTLDASRNYQTLRRPAIVHDHPRQVSSIT
jgi:transposase InsO family protein